MFASLRNRVYVAIIFVATIPILTLGLMTSQRAADELERQSLTLQTELALRIEREIAGFINARLNELRVLERTSQLLDMDEKEVSAALGRLLAQDQLYQSLMLLGVDGRVLGATSRTRVILPGSNLQSGLKVDESALWSGKERQYVGPIEYDKTQREPLLDIAISIISRQHGETRAMLLGRVRVASIWRLLGDLRLSSDTEAFVINSNGRILAHREAAKVLSAAHFDPPSVSGRHRLEDGRPGLVVIRPLSMVSEPAQVVVTRPLDSALNVASANRQLILVTTFLLLLLAVLLALLLSRQIVQPIEALASAARRITRGQLDSRIEVSGPEEIHALGNSLKHMTERLKTTIEELEQSEYSERQRAMVTLASIGDAVITTDAVGRVTYLNPVAENLSGWPLQEARQQSLTDVFHIVNEQTREPAPDPVARCLTENRVVGLANHTLLLSRDGREYAIQDSAAPIIDRDGSVLGAVIVFSDVSAARAMQQKISHQASHDALTGLVNRREFEKRLSRVIETSVIDSSVHALCYLDLDRFKQVNDICGHAAGDELLRQIALIFQRKIRQRDTLARIGGDEFTVLLERCDLPHAARVAEELRASLDDFEFTWEGNHRFSLGVSIGLVPIDGSNSDLNAILRAADKACYQAKHSGRNKVQIYSPDDYP